MNNFREKKNTSISICMRGIRNRNYVTNKKEKQTTHRRRRRRTKQPKTKTKCRQGQKNTLDSDERKHNNNKTNQQITPRV